MKKKSVVTSVEMDIDFDLAAKQMKTEHNDILWLQEGKKMSLHSLLNEDRVVGCSPTDLQDTNGYSVAITVPDADHDSGARSMVDSERCMVIREVALGDGDCNGVTPSLQRINICSICHSDTGRCHASDTASMQAFFSSSLGYSGVLNSSDWLCMKCYSKWYNRCKRKATVVPVMNDSSPAQSQVPSETQPPAKRKRNGKTSISPSPSDQQTKPKKDKEKEIDREKETERDEGDDALLLARISQQNTPTTPTNIQRDLEDEVDELRGELVRVRGEVVRLSQELLHRDEQMEDMLKFVKTEIAAMHVLLKEIAEAKWKTSTHPIVNSVTPSMIHVQAGASPVDCGNHSPNKVMPA